MAFVLAIHALLLIAAIGSIFVDYPQPTSTKKQLCEYGSEYCEGYAAVTICSIDYPHERLVVCHSCAYEACTHDGYN